MTPLQRTRRGWWLPLLALLASLVISGPASAHTELRQSSPEAGETVGGDFHQIVLLLLGWDAEAPFSAELFDPSGARIESEVKTDNQRLVMPIEGLTVPGLYTVTYTVTSVDRDVTSDSFTFRFDPSAPPPKGITVEVGTGQGFDFVALGLLMVLAALAAFLVQRFRTALREHRAARSGP
jgi:methionine-rich copper-binding protein CopC